MFINDYVRYGYRYLMKNNSKAFEKFKEFRRLKSKGKGILIIRLDHDSEYLSQGFIDYLKEN